MGLSHILGHKSVSEDNKDDHVVKRVQRQPMHWCFLKVIGQKKNYYKSHEDIQIVKYILEKIEALWEFCLYGDIFWTQMARDFGNSRSGVSLRNRYHRIITPELYDPNCR